MFEVELKKSAKKELGACPSDYQTKIKEALYFLRENPYPFRFFDVRKVKARGTVYGIRIGKYRILYEILKEEKLILILKIDLKSETTYK